MTNIVPLDLSGVSSEEEFQDRLSRALAFPHYYGRNLDACWDCITDIIEETQVELTGLTSLEEPIRVLVNGYIELISEYEAQTEGAFRLIIK